MNEQQRQQRQGYQRGGGQQRGGRQESRMQQGGGRQGGMQRSGGQHGQQGAQQGTQPGGGQLQQQAQQRAPTFEESIPFEFTEALADIDRVETVAEWCKDQCLDSGPEMANCARVCDDIAEIAKINEELIARNSLIGPRMAEMFLEAADQAIPELQQHQQNPQIKETLVAVQRAAESIEIALDSIGQGRMQQGGQQGGMQQGRQQGGRQQGGQQSDEFQTSY